MSDTAVPAAENPAATAPEATTPGATAPGATANDNGGDTAPPADLAAGGRGGRLPRILRGKRRRFFLLLIVNGIAQTAVTVGAALLVRRFFDGVAAGGAADGGVMQHLPRTGAVLMGLALALVALRIVERRWSEAMAQDYAISVRLRLFDAVARIPLWTLKKRSRGPMMLRFASDISAVHDWVGRGLARLTVGGIAMVGVLGGLFVLDPWFAGATLGVLALGGAVTLAVGPLLERRVFELRRSRGKLAAQVADKLEALALLRLFDREEEERRLLKRQSRKVARHAVARAGYSALVRVLPEAVYLGALTAILVLAAHRLAAGMGSIGALAGALMLLGLLALPLRDLARVFDYFQNFKVARRKLEQILAEAAESDRVKPTKRVPLSGALMFRRVTVEGLLHGVSARVPSGLNIAIVGPTGGGKSLLLALAAGLARPDKGRVRLDGVAVDRLPSGVLARNVGMVSAELPLLRGTIRDNLVYRDETATDEEVERAIRAFGLNLLARDLPDGLDTAIADGGVDLSAGTAQRIHLARAMLGRPKLVLLDEPDRGLDAEGRRALGRVLAEHRCTTLIATQDLERARSCDRIWYLDSGRLMEEGPAAELLAGDGPTARYFGLTPDEPRLSVVS
jgi:ABC-type multidrug transport system fused ATPase/permease subunit